MGRGGRPRNPASRSLNPDRYRGEPLPEVTVSEQPSLPDVRDWCEVTLNWWADWGSSEYANYLTAIDWQQLIDAALLHDAVYVEGELRYSSELRIKQNNVRELAERRMIQAVGVRAVRPSGVVEGEVVADEPREIEQVKPGISKFHYDVLRKEGFTDEELAERFTLPNDG